MLSQEDIYQLLFKEEWKKILDILYSHKKDIPNDTLLEFAARTFEGAFFQKIDKIASSDTKVLEYLDTLYILHHGNFYKLSDLNYKLLVLELAKRKPLNEAINYAKLIPDDGIAKDIIDRYNRTIEVDNDKKGLPVDNVTWTTVFNQVFDLINDKDDAATYISGPKFISIIKEFIPYFPDYTQFIDIRNKEGKSTTRKIYYYDILFSLDAINQQKVIHRILDLVRPFNPLKVSDIDTVLGNKKGKNIEKKPELPADKGEHPIVFISYSWDDEEHKKWVLDLANKLRENGIDVILDRYYLSAGKSVTYFVENSIKRADRIIIVYTPNYKLKADKRTGGVGYEYSIINSGLYQNQTDSDKIIPIIRRGTVDESIPTFMTQFIHIDMRNDSNYDNSYTDLIREIFNEPAIVMPSIGVKPKFS